MKKLKVPLSTSINITSSMEQVSSSLNELPKHSIDIAPWPEFNYVPRVEFSIAHGGDCIFLKFYVTEAVVKAVYYKPNDPVYKDSCVEFFIAFNDEEEYYNIEFNAIGTCKLNFGINRHNRILVSESLIKTIRYFSTIENKTGSDGKPAIQWQLTLIIPVAVFLQHKIESLSGQDGSANFYKCGDDLPVPHFLCWNNIQSAEPDFHVRECFGKILFL